MRSFFVTLFMVRATYSKILIMKNVFTLLALFLIGLLNAQQISIISENSQKPIPKVIIFGKNGNILTTTDIDGKFNREALEPKQDAYQLVYNNTIIADLSYQDISKEMVYVNEKTKDIDAVVIKGKPSKYVYLTGNFNTYVTINSKLNAYADGIVTYVFDNKTKKYKSTKVEQYRVYIMENALENRKQVATMVFDNILTVPKLKNLSRIDELIAKKNLKFKEVSEASKDEMEFTGEIFQEKEFSFFGYRFFDIRSILNMSFEKAKERNIKSFLEYNEIAYLKLKHKSEPEYNQFITYSNFYPLEMSFHNDVAIDKVKFKRDNSQYTTKFWEQEGFPDMLPVFNQYFKGNMKEMPNQK